MHSWQYWRRRASISGEPQSTYREFYIRRITTEAKLKGTGEVFAIFLPLQLLEPQDCVAAVQRH